MSIFFVSAAWSRRLRDAALSSARLLYRKRRFFGYTIVALATVAAFAAAFVVRFEFRWPAEYTDTFLYGGALLVALRLVTARFFRIHLHRWRYADAPDYLEIVLATASASLAFWGLLQVIAFQPAVPRSVLLLELVFASYAMGIARTVYRAIYGWARQRRADADTDASELKRTLVVGAGEAGSLLAQEIQQQPRRGYRLVGFVDDDPAKAGARIRGAEVLGTTDQIPALVREHAVDKLIVAVPSAGPAALRRIVSTCESTRVRLLILPPDRNVFAGPVQLSQLRQIRVEDLLGRDPIHLRLPELAADLEGEVVLITGAAGSIGSELARQVAIHRPARLILYDQAETDLFYVDMELRQRHPDIEIEPVVGDILDPARVGEIFRTHRPSRVFHAAAYKHVPMMESNPGEAVRNNVIGTWRLLDAAAESGAAKFVLISTDKAVNPISVMGATKRAAELLLLSCAERHPGTRFTAVRFGNVLGSQGSVVPIFKKQLAEGRKLTVTHRDATRYFMTIPEAVQLVLQASVLEEARGNISMLDMGEPVRIVDLARNVLRLSGETDPDSRIEFVGLRPGERLHEELTNGQEESRQSRHPKVQLVVHDPEVWKVELRSRLRSLHGVIPSEDGETLEGIWDRCSHAADEAERKGPSLFQRLA